MFQFHYGSIKGYSPARYSIYLHGFNSTMVRLKVKADKITFQQRVFQFHYGSIKGVTNS